MSASSCTIGVVLYVVQNVLIDVKLKEYSTVSLLRLLSHAFATGTGHSVPEIYGPRSSCSNGDALKVVAAVAFMFFVADFFYIGRTQVVAM